MKAEFRQSEKFPQIGKHNPLPRLELKANVLMYFVRIPKN